MEILIIFYTVIAFFKKPYELMTPKTAKVPSYPRSHILAASGVAALLSLALLVFPTREVEAKKSHLSLDVTSSAEQFIAPAVDDETNNPSSPFAQIDLQSTADTTTAEQADESEDPLHKRLTVQSGDTLSTLFSKLGLPSSAVHDVLASSKEAKQFTRLKAGQELEFELDTAGQLVSMHSKLNRLESIRLSRTEAGYAFEREHVKPEIRTRYSHGVIDSSLFVSARKAGLSHGLTMDLANVFGYDIDFAMDLREGDEFELIYEEKVVENEQVGTGNILAARFTNKGKTFTAVRHTDSGGRSSYFNADGTSTRKAFIRTPVDFARISSRFSNGRRHPILNKIRAHKGVDYAAPRGTPIKSAGDGRVVLAGRKGGYGNTIVIQHGQRYQTLYAHMQGFAKGIRNGSSVRQGQIIGYIGTTGLSTGPHLHYEFQVNGVHVDPLSQKLPMADPLNGNEKRRFMQTSQPLMARMDQEKASLLAHNGE